MLLHAINGFVYDDDEIERNRMMIVPTNTYGTAPIVRSGNKMYNQHTYYASSSTTTIIIAFFIIGKS